MRAISEDRFWEHYDPQEDTDRRGPHRDRLFEVDLDEKPT